MRGPGRSARVSVKIRTGVRADDVKNVAFLPSGVSSYRFWDTGDPDLLAVVRSVLTARTNTPRYAPPGPPPCSTA